MNFVRKLPVIAVFLFLGSNGFAGQPAARLTDATTFDGTIIQGSPTVLINNQPAARRSDLIFTPHFVFPSVCVGGPIIQGSVTVFINGLGAARLGDIATTSCGPEAIVTGSPSVLIGN